MLLMAQDSVDDSVTRARPRASSLSDLGDRSEDGGRARPDNPDFEAHSGPTQRENGVIMDRHPIAAVDSS